MEEHDTICIFKLAIFIEHALVRVRLRGAYQIYRILSESEDKMLPVE
jgi:hypothetical protein